MIMKPLSAAAGLASLVASTYTASLSDCPGYSVSNKVEADRILSRTVAPI